MPRPAISAAATRRRSCARSGIDWRQTFVSCDEPIRPMPLINPPDPRHCPPINFPRHEWLRKRTDLPRRMAPSPHLPVKVQLHQPTRHLAEKSSDMAHDHDHVATATLVGHDGAFAIGIGLNRSTWRWRPGSGCSRARWRCWPTPATTCPTCSGCCWPGAPRCWPGARRRRRRTYGLRRRSSILASLANAMLLLVAIGAIASEAVHRLQRRRRWPPASCSGRRHGRARQRRPRPCCSCAAARADLNIRGAFLHMAADAAVSAGVVVGGAA